MKEIKRTYYRNWYQHWQQEKEEEEKIKAMKYFSDLEVEGEQPFELDIYRPKYEVNLQDNQELQQILLDGKSEGVSHEVIRKSNASGELVRNLLIGLPLVLVLATALYAAGIIPQEMVNQIFNPGMESTLVTFISNHDEVMILHNEINQTLENHILNNQITTEFQQEIQTKHSLVQQETDLFMEQSTAISSDMNRLWALKMLSLNQMVTYVLENDEVTQDVLDYYTQFVQDQNEIGEQISLALSNLLVENNVNFIQLPTGDMEIQ